MSIDFQGDITVAMSIFKLLLKCSNALLACVGTLKYSLHIGILRISVTTKMKRKPHLLMLLSSDALNVVCYV